MIDIIFMKDIHGETFTYLSILDDATVFHVVESLEDRAEKHVVEKLVRGWFRYYGIPDEALLDAKGAMKGWSFENLMSQSGVAIRFVPADAHYQLGKAERHGQSIKWIMRRLTNQFAASGWEEMDLLVTMSIDLVLRHISGCLAAIHAYQAPCCLSLRASRPSR